MRGDYDSGTSESQDLTKLVGPVKLTALLEAIQSIKNNQHTLIEEISKLQHSSQALWQQGLENRQQVRRQQDTINRILRFLGGVFGSSNVGDILHNSNNIDMSALDEFSRHGDFASSHSHRFQEHDTATNAAPNAKGPIRPQKRPRLLISDSSYNEPMGPPDLSSVLDTNAATTLPSDQRFSEATSDSESNSPRLWAEPAPMPDSPNLQPLNTKSVSKGGLSPPNPSWIDAPMADARTPEGQTMDTNMQNAHSAWMSHLMAHETPADGNPANNAQLLAALQDAMAQGSSKTTASSSTQSPSPMHGIVDGPKSNPAINSMLLPWHPATASSDGTVCTPVSTEQLLSNVQRINQEAHQSLDQTNQLQNQINTLVQNLRLGPRNGNANAAASYPPNAVLQSSKRPDTDQFPWMGPTPPTAPSVATTSPGNAAATGETTATTMPQDEFDLDSFLNQFVEPTDIPGGQHGGALSDGPDDMASEANSVKANARSS